MSDFRTIPKYIYIHGLYRYICTGANDKRLETEIPLSAKGFRMRSTYNDIWGVAESLNGTMAGKF